MSTAPAPISTVPTISAVSTFLKAHERVIVLILCLAAAIFVYDKGLDLVERHDQRVANAATAMLQVQQAKDSAVATANQQAAVQTQQATVQYQQLAAQLLKTNTALVVAQAARDNALTVQQSADKVLPPQALAIRLQSQLNLTPKDVTTNADLTAFELTPVAIQEAVTQLDRIPQLQSNLADEQTIVVNNSRQLQTLTALNSNLTALNMGLNTQIAGLNTQIKDQIAADAADLKLVKAQARKSKLKWFIAGFVGGLIAGRYIP